MLPFAGSVPQLAALMEVDGALEGVVRLALVQSDLDPTSHPGVRGPVDHEQGAFDAADFPQGRRQLVLARVRGELAQDLQAGQWRLRHELYQTRRWPQRSHCST